MIFDNQYVVREFIMTTKKGFVNFLIKISIFRVQKNPINDENSEAKQLETRKKRTHN